MVHLCYNEKKIEGICFQIFFGPDLKLSGLTQGRHIFYLARCEIYRICFRRLRLLKFDGEVTSTRRK